MENKVKKAKVDYAAIIREFEIYGRGRYLRQFCDESNYTYANVLHYYRKSFWNCKAKSGDSSKEDNTLVHLENRIGNMPIVNKQVKILTAFPSSQMSRAKLALAMSWRGNVSNSIYRHLQKCLYIEY